jgi:hypothetical protein
MIFASWNPDISAALLLLAMILALCAVDIRGLIAGRRFFSAEKRKLENVERWWTERARGER